MVRSRMTRSELEEDNALLRERLAEARDLIDEALGIEDVDPYEGEDDEDADVV